MAEDPPFQTGSTSTIFAPRLKRSTHFHGCSRVRPVATHGGYWARTLATVVLPALLSVGCAERRTPDTGLSPLVPLTIATGRYYARAGKHLSYLIDPDGRLEFGQVMDRRARLPFRRNRSEYASFGFMEGAVWLELRVRANATSKRRYLLELQNSLLRHVDFYLLKDGRIAQQFRGGLHAPPSLRPIEHRYYIYPLDLEPGEVGTVYFRVSSTETLNVPIFLWDEVEFYRKDTPRNFAYGLFFGLILVMAVYNLFIFLSVRDRSYLYYVVYMLLLGGLFALIHGYAYLFFHSLLVRVEHWIGPFCALASSLAALAFARRFLLLKDSIPKGYAIVTALMVAHGAAAAALPLLPSYYPGLLGNGIPLLATLAIPVLAVMRVRQGFKPARYFLLAWMFIIAGAVTYILQNFGLLLSNFFTNNALLFGAALEALLLSFALGYRINELTRAEEGARQNTIREQERALALQQRMSEAFERFVPREFLNHLDRASVLDIRHGDAVQRSMCVLFTDIRDFTALSEKLGSEAVFRMLNEYLARMAPIIEGHGGFIDKFIGDAIMALFQDPASGTRAAVEMAAAMDALAAEPHMPSQMRAGYGLHFGELMLGTLGSPRRLETTVIGDTVNLAARIESVTKQYGSRIIVSDAVYRAIAAENNIPAREIDTVFVKGKARPVVLFEVFAADPPPEREAKELHSALFLSGLAYFRSGEFSEARARFIEYRAACDFDPLPRIFLDRIAELERRDPGSLAQWTGIYETW